MPAIFMSWRSICRRDAKSPRKVVAFDYRGRGHRPTIPTQPITMSASRPATSLPGWRRSASSDGRLHRHVARRADHPCARRDAAGRAESHRSQRHRPGDRGEGLAHIRSYLERAPKPKTLAEAVAAQRAAHGGGFSGADRGRLGADGGGALPRDGWRPGAGFRPDAARTLVRISISTSRCPRCGRNSRRCAAVPLAGASAAPTQRLTVRHAKRSTVADGQTPSWDRQPARNHRGFRQADRRATRRDRWA